MGVDVGDSVGDTKGFGVAVGIPNGVADAVGVKVGDSASAASSWGAAQAAKANTSIVPKSAKKGERSFNSLASIVDYYNRKSLCWQRVVPNSTGLFKSIYPALATLARC